MKEVLVLYAGHFFDIPGDPVTVTAKKLALETIPQEYSELHNECTELEKLKSVPVPKRSSFSFGKESKIANLEQNLQIVPSSFYMFLLQRYIGKWKALMEALNENETTLKIQAWNTLVEQVNSLQLNGNYAPYFVSTTTELRIACEFAKGKMYLPAGKVKTRQSSNEKGNKYSGYVDTFVIPLEQLQESRAIFALDLLARGEICLNNRLRTQEEVTFPIDYPYRFWLQRNGVEYGKTSYKATKDMREAIEVALMEHGYKNVPYQFVANNIPQGALPSKSAVLLRDSLFLAAARILRNQRPNTTDQIISIPPEDSKFPLEPLYVCALLSRVVNTTVHGFMLRIALPSRDERNAYGALVQAITCPQLIKVIVTIPPNRTETLQKTPCKKKLSNKQPILDGSYLDLIQQLETTRTHPFTLEIHADNVSYVLKFSAPEAN